MRVGGFFAALALVLGVCAPTVAELASARPARHAVHPVSGLPVVPLTISGRGRVHRFRVELAGTPDEQARGLMFRKAMAPDEGMIFPMDPPRYAVFWMHDTVLSLDIVFVGSDRRILTIAANATPYSEAQIPSGGVVSAVLELNAGRAAALGLRPGDPVRWQAPTLR